MKISPQKTLKTKIDDFFKNKKLNSKLDSLSLSREELIYGIDDPWLFNFIVSKVYFAWGYVNLVCSNLEQNLDVSEYILKKDLSLSYLYDVKHHIVKTGLYESSLDIKKIYPYLNKQAKLEVLSLFNAEIAKQAVLDKDQDIRLAAYIKLGVGENLTSMLKDRAAQIRKQALEVVPYNDPRINEMIGERSKYAFLYVIKKIDKNNLPLLLSNSNIKEAFLRQEFDSRLKKLGE